MRRESYHFVVYCDGGDGRGHASARGATLSQEFSEPSRWMSIVAARCAGWLLGTTTDLCPACAKRKLSEARKLKGKPLANVLRLAKHPKKVAG